MFIPQVTDKHLGECRISGGIEFQMQDITGFYIHCGIQTVPITVDLDDRLIEFDCLGIWTDTGFKT